MSTTPTIDTHIQLDGLSKTAAELKAFADRVRAMSNEVTRAARTAGGALRRAFGPQTNAAIVATAGNLALVRRELKGIATAAARADARLSGLGNGLGNGAPGISGESVSPAERAAREAAAAARDQAKADARAALVRAQTQARTAAATARTQAQAVAAAAKTQARSAAAAVRLQTANIRARATVDAAAARSQASIATANARIRTTDARMQARAAAAAARSQAASVRAANARAAVTARTQARAAAAAARTQAADARSRVQATIAAGRAQAQAAAAAARLHAANARDEARATAARLRTEAQAAAAAAKVEATRARDAARAAAAKSQARSRAAVAAVRRVGNASDGVAKSATRVGKRMAVTGSKVLAILAAIAVAGKAAGVAVAGIAGLGAGALVAAGSVTLATNTATTQETAAKETGTTRANAVGIKGAATALGLEAGEAEGAITSLRDKLRDAAAGGESAALFKRLGVDAKDASGKVRDTVDVLGDLDRATKSMSGKDRTKAFEGIFGDDAAKMIDFVDRGGLDKIRKSADRANSFGAVATEADIAIVRDFKSAIGDLILSFRGLALAVSRQILPGLTKTTKGLAEWIAANREVFANSFSRGWERVMQSMKGAVGILRIIPLASGMVIRSMHTLLGVFSDVGKYLAGDYINIERSWVYELTRAIHATIKTFSVLVGSGGGGLIGALSRGWVIFLGVIAQVYAAFLSLDHGVSYGWILTMRDAVMQVIGVIRQIPAFVAALPAQFELAKAYFLAMIESMRVTMINAMITVLTTGMALADAVMVAIEARVAAIYKRAADAVQPFVDAIRDVFELMRDGDAAKTESPWILAIRDQLLSVREVAIHFWTSLKEAWALFKGVLDTIHGIIKPIIEFFGYDVLTAALFLGMLRLSGLLGLMTGAVNLLIAGFTRLFAMGMAGTLGAGIQGFLTGIVGQMTKLAAMIPQIAVLAAAAWAGAEAGKYLGKKAYQWSGLEARDGLREANVMSDLKRVQESSYDRRVASLAHLPKPVTTSQRAPFEPPMIDIWERRDRMQASESVEVNFNVGAQSSRLSGTRDSVDSLLRSLNDARNAGGIR